MQCSHTTLGPIAQTHVLQKAFLPFLVPKTLHVHVCAQMLGNKHTLDTVLPVHTGSLLLMYRHPDSASAQKPALVLKQYLQSLK